MQTVHGSKFQWTWNLESGPTTLKMVRRIKDMIDTLYDGNPYNFKGRIIIFQNHEVYRTNRLFCSSKPKTKSIAIEFAL